MPGSPEHRGALGWRWSSRASSFGLGGRKILSSQRLASARARSLKCSQNYPKSYPIDRIYQPLSTVCAPASVRTAMRSRLALQSQALASVRSPRNAPLLRSLRSCLGFDHLWRRGTWTSSANSTASVAGAPTRRFVPPSARSLAGGAGPSVTPSGPGPRVRPRSSPWCKAPRARENILASAPPLFVGTACWSQSLRPLVFCWSSSTSFHVGQVFGGSSEKAVAAQRSCIHPTAHRHSAEQVKVWNSDQRGLNGIAPGRLTGHGRGSVASSCHTSMEGTCSYKWTSTLTSWDTREK